MIKRSSYTVFRQKELLNRETKNGLDRKIRTTLPNHCNSSSSIRNSRKRTVSLTQTQHSRPENLSKIKKSPSLGDIIFIAAINCFSFIFCLCDDIAHLTRKKFEMIASP